MPMMLRDHQPLKNRVEDDVVSICSVLDITLPRLGRELRRREQIRRLEKSNQVREGGRRKANLFRGIVSLWRDSAWHFVEASMVIVLDCWVIGQPKTFFSFLSGMLNDRIGKETGTHCIACWYKITIYTQCCAICMTFPKEGRKQTALLSVVLPLPAVRGSSVFSVNNGGKEVFNHYWKL